MIYRCLLYDFISGQTLVQLKQGEGVFDVLMKLFRVLGYPGVELHDCCECRMIVQSLKILLTSRLLVIVSNIIVN